MSIITAYVLGAFMVGYFTGFGAALLICAGVYKIIQAKRAAKDE